MNTYTKIDVTRRWVIGEIIDLLDFATDEELSEALSVLQSNKTCHNYRIIKEENESFLNKE